MYKEPNWKTIWAYPRYEISEEGQVRVKEGFRNAGRVLNRFWKDRETVKGYLQDTFEDGPGSLCVELHDFPKHTTRRIWKLMEKYWPDVKYPATWKADRPVAKPAKKNGGPDKRFKLTYEQTLEIKRSPLSSRDLAEMYPVSRRYIHYLKTGK